MIHLAALGGGIAYVRGLPHTLTEANNALQHAVIRAALELDVERFVYVSSPAVFERAELFPTPEEYLPQCPTPLSADGFSKLTGEMYCRAAHEEHGLPYTICRPFNAYGPGEVAGAEPGTAHVLADLIEKVLSGQRPLQILGSGEQTRTLTHVDDVADGVIAAMSSPAGLERGLQHLRLARADDRARSRASCGRHAARTRARSSSSTCPHRRSMRSAAGRRWRRRGSCSAGGRASRSRRASRRPRGGFASGAR